MKELVIVGGGVVGRCVARQASQTHKVTLIDQDDPDHKGCSWGNSGYLVPSHFVPLASPGMLWAGFRMLFNRESPFGMHRPWTPDTLRWLFRFMQHCNTGHTLNSQELILTLNLRSQELYRKWAAEWAEAPVSERGLILACEQWDTLDHETKGSEVAKSLGLAAEVIGPEEVSARVGTNVSSIGGVHYQCDSHLTPGDVLVALDRDLDERGVTRVTGAVRDIQLGDSLQVKAGSETFGGDQVVIAAGAASGSLARMLDLRLPMAGGKGYSMVIEDTGLVTTPLIMLEGRMALTPLSNGIRVAGTMELGATDLSINPHRLAGIEQTLRRTVPGIAGAARIGEVWSGLRPCSPDGLPYIGALQRDSRVIFATGHAMMGMSLGPITGELVAQILRGEQPELDINRLNPERFK